MAWTTYLDVSRSMSALLGCVLDLTSSFRGAVLVEDAWDAMMCSLAGA